MKFKMFDLNFADENLTNQRHLIYIVCLDFNKTVILIKIPVYPAPKVYEEANDALFAYLYISAHLCV